MRRTKDIASPLFQPCYLSVAHIYPTSHLLRLETIKASATLPLVKTHIRHATPAGFQHFGKHNGRHLRTLVICG
ncbi:hypothetical protein VTI74DRAFT_889 [Chaetomium olivicolor]